MLLGFFFPGVARFWLGLFESKGAWTLSRSLTITLSLLPLSHGGLEDFMRGVRGNV